MRQKGFAPLIIILVVAILGVIGYFAYKNYISPKGTILGPYSPSPIATTTPDPTANWKTYSNTIRSIGFSFKYPQNLYYTEDPNFGPAFFNIADKDKDPRTVVSKFEVTINDLGEDFDKLYSLADNTVISVDKPMIGYKETKLKNTTLGNQKAVRYEISFTNNYATYYMMHVLAKMNNQFIEIHTSNDGTPKDEYDNFKATFDQILSTFKFTQ